MLRPRNKLIAILVAILLLAGGGWWWKNHDKAEPAPKRVAIGSSGLYAAGPDAAKLTAKPVKRVKTEKLVSERLTKPYDIRVKGDKLSAPVTLWIPTTAKPGDSVMLASKHPGKPWDYFGSERGDVKVERIDGVNYLRATVPHLSIDIGFSPRDWITDQWKAALNKSTAGVYVDKSIPKCRDQATAGKLGYGLGVAQKGAITACVGYNNDAAELIVKNIKRYPLVAKHPDFKRVKGPASQLAAAALDFDGSKSTTLMPGDTVTLSKQLEVGRHAQVKTEFNGWTQNMYRVDVSIHALVQMYSIMRGGKADYNDIADIMLQIVDCRNAIHKSAAGEVINSCFSPQIMQKIAKKTGSPVDRAAVVGEFGNGLSTWLVSETTSAIDTIRGGDRATLQLNRHAPKAPKYDLPHRCGEASSGGTVTILENSVSCEEALAVAAAYGRGAAQPRTITSKDCVKSGCVITGSWKCGTVSEGETECWKGTALIRNGSPVTANFRGTWHTHNMTITVTSGTKGRIDWGETGNYSATFTYSPFGDTGYARIKSSTMQSPKTNEYYGFKVGASYTMKLDGYMLSMTNGSDPSDSVAGCGRGHETDCGM